MFDFRRLLCNLNTMELQELCCDVAEACALHVYYRGFEPDFDEPLFVKTFEETYNHIMRVFSCDDYYED